MKKLLILSATLLSVLLILAMTACDAIPDLLAGSSTPTEGLAYTLNDDGTSYSVSGIGTATAANIVIADVYEGLPVTSIDELAFLDCKNIVKITIPDSVTSIGRGAFSKSAIKSITIPGSVASILEATFYKCDSLTNVTLKSGVTSIDKSAFAACSRLKASFFRIL